MKKTLKERFDEKWVEDENGCWAWTAYKQPNGYGQIGEGGKHGKTLRAHRVSFEIYKGEIPKSTCVLHTCDNPACVNPQHLFLGSHDDNMQDKCVKGRQPVGVEHGRHQLTEEEVVKIRLLYDEKQTSHRVIGEMFAVSHSNVQAIGNRKTWKHLP